MGKPSAGPLISLIFVSNCVELSHHFKNKQLYYYNYYVHKCELTLISPREVHASAEATKVANSFVIFPLLFFFLPSLLFSKEGLF